MKWVSLLFVPFAVLACTDTIDPQPSPIFNTAYLTREGGWQITSIKKEEQQSITELFFLKSNCLKDDIYRFNSGGTYSILESGEECVQGAPPIKENGTWEIDAGIFSMIPEGDAAKHFMLVELSGTLFLYKEIEVGGGGIVQSVTTYRLQPTQ